MQVGALLSVSAQDALAASLTEDSLALLDGTDGTEPTLGDLLLDAEGCGSGDLCSLLMTQHPSVLEAAAAKFHQSGH